jgi:hypothetical protein
VVVVSDAKDTGIAVNFAQAYGRVISQPEVLDRVADEVGIPAAALRTRVQASTSPDAPLIEITASARSAVRSARIANAAVRALVAYGNLHVTETGVRMASFSQAAVPVSPSSPRPVLDAAVGAATGVLLGGLAVLAGVGNRRRGTATRRRYRKRAALPDSAGMTGTTGDAGPRADAGTAADAVDGAENGVPATNAAPPKGDASPGNGASLRNGASPVNGASPWNGVAPRNGADSKEADADSQDGTGPEDGGTPSSDAGPAPGAARKASVEAPGDIPAALAATDTREAGR